MAVQFRTRDLTIPRGAGAKQFEDTLIFPGTVADAQVALKSFHFEFEDFDDHPLRVVEVRTSIIQILQDSVRVRVFCQFADHNLDDPYVGDVELLVIANVA